MPAQSVSQTGSTDLLSAAADLLSSSPTQPAPLSERLREVALDRASTAEDLVLETAQVVLDWLLQRPDGWSWSVAGGELETGLAEWNMEQGWRGPAALWMDTLRRTWYAGSAAHPREAREVLAEELGLWLWSRDADAAVAGDLDPADAPWNGTPLAPGRRLASRVALAAHAAASLEPGELVLLNAYSHTVALALAAAWRAGKHPEVVVCEGLPSLEGRRMARRLSRAGLMVTLCYDATLNTALARADRVWLGTESIGVDAFLGRVGTRSLLEEAARLEVPVELLATSDKLMPAGELYRPSWPERDTWLLWDEAPENVRLETQCFEAAPLDLVGHLITECGHETPARLSLRALRETRPAACGQTGSDDPGAAIRSARRPLSQNERDKREEVHVTRVDGGRNA